MSGARPSSFPFCNADRLSFAIQLLPAFLKAPFLKKRKRKKKKSTDSKPVATAAVKPVSRVAGRVAQACTVRPKRRAKCKAFFFLTRWLTICFGSNKQGGAAGGASPRFTEGWVVGDTPRRAASVA